MGAKLRRAEINAPQAIRLEPCSVSPGSPAPVLATPPCGVGSDAWGLNPWATRGAGSHAMAKELLRTDPCGYP